MSFDHKDDLRLRMIDLEKKLAESEEERCKLEKTCNALMKAFREEEKMRYKVLNKKYEKFLQDCTVRKRRNDIILRSLCRIEDRSRALFAKTERLKLLKDRYIYYLKISDEKKDDASSQLIFPFSSSSQKTISDTSPKSVQWKTPIATDIKAKKFEHAIISQRTSDTIPKVFTSGFYTNSQNFLNKQSEEVQEKEEVENSERIIFNGTSHTESSTVTSAVQNKLSLDKTNSVFSDSPGKPNSVRLKSKELSKINNQIKSENGNVSKLNTFCDNLEVKNLTEVLGSVVSRQESIAKLKKVSSSEEECSDNENRNKRQDLYDGKVVDKDDTEPCDMDPTKIQNSSPVVTSRTNHSFMTIHSSNSDEETCGNLPKNVGMETEANHQGVSSGGSLKNTKFLPMGLDGIDYQDETYPESYYEQPVHHHNHTNIAADVILEEDETEPDGEEEKDLFTDITFNKTQFFRGDSDESNSSERSPGEKTCSERNKKDPNCKETELGNKGFDEIKTQEQNSEKNLEANQSDANEDEPKRDKSQSFAFEKSDKIKSSVRSNLLHLLESDSESFQIEHGDVVSGNEGSDFDFSFH